MALPEANAGIIENATIIIASNVEIIFSCVSSSFYTIFCISSILLAYPLELPPS